MEYEKCCGNCIWKYTECDGNDCRKMPNDGYCFNWEESEPSNGVDETTQIDF